LRKIKIGLALGGGAARGLAHVGVIRVLEKAGIPIRVVAGTSMGALIGAKYALNPHADVLEEDVSSFLNSQVFKEVQKDFGRESEEESGFFFHLARFISQKVIYTLALTQRSLIKGDTIQKVMEFFFPDIPVEFTRLPFAATAVDLKTGGEVALKGGPLRKVIAASCALPGVLPPVELGDYELVDGGWLNLVPGDVTRFLGADMVIGVCVSSGVEDFTQWNNCVEILSRADEITRHYLGKLRLRECDVLITPQVADIEWNQFTRAREAIKAGEEAALKALPTIRRLIKRCKWKRWLPQRSPEECLTCIPFEVYP